MKRAVTGGPGNLYDHTAEPQPRVLGLIINRHATPPPRRASHRCPPAGHSPPPRTRRRPLASQRCPTGWVFRTRGQGASYAQPPLSIVRRDGDRGRHGTCPSGRSDGRYRRTGQ